MILLFVAFAPPRNKFKAKRATTRATMKAMIITASFNNDVHTARP